MKKWNQLHRLVNLAFVVSLVTSTPFLMADEAVLGTVAPQEFSTLDQDQQQVTAAAQQEIAEENLPADDISENFQDTDNLDSSDEF